MVIWYNLKNEKPLQYQEVLVENNLFGDDNRTHFVASYIEEENEWLQSLAFQPELSPHIAITRKALDDDCWCYIPPIDKPIMDLIEKEKFIGKRFKFPKYNTVNWSQDFSCYTNNIPHDQIFCLKEFISNKRVVLVAPGHGGNPYGNGAICVNLAEILSFILSD